MAKMKEWEMRMAESNRLEPEPQGNFWKDDRWWAWFRDNTRIAGEQPISPDLFRA